MNIMKTGLSIVALLALNWTTFALAQTASPLPVPTKYSSDYYNRARTHLSLSRDSPDERAIQPLEQGIVREIEHIGGLHHEYVRAAA